MRNQGFDRYQSDDSWTRYRLSTESRIRKFEAFQRAVQARKAQQIQQQKKEQDLFTVAKYWADSFNNAKTIHEIFNIHEWMSKMETTVQQAQNLEGGTSPYKPPQHDE